jgi:hypothetical protein
VLQINIKIMIIILQFELLSGNSQNTACIAVDKRQLCEITSCAIKTAAQKTKQN